jgi:hypothetical protein
MTTAVVRYYFLLPGDMFGKTNTPDMVTQLWPELEASISMDE